MSVTLTGGRRSMPDQRRLGGPSSKSTANGRKSTRSRATAEAEAYAQSRAIRNRGIVPNAGADSVPAAGEATPAAPTAGLDRFRSRPDPEVSRLWTFRPRPTPADRPEPGPGGARGPLTRRHTTLTPRLSHSVIGRAFWRANLDGVLYPSFACLLPLSATYPTDGVNVSKLRRAGPEPHALKKRSVPSDPVVPRSLPGSSATAERTVALHCKGWPRGRPTTSVGRLDRLATRPIPSRGVLPRRRAAT